jgi:hypothetical protein
VRGTFFIHYIKKIHKNFRKIILFITFLSCGPNNTNTETGRSSPIDSTNVNGTAPATHGPDDAANDSKDSNRGNVNDTGTKANNVHRQGNLPEEQVKK